MLSKIGFWFYDRRRKTSPVFLSHAVICLALTVSVRVVRNYLGSLLNHAPVPISRRYTSLSSSRLIVDGLPCPCVFTNMTLSAIGSGRIGLTLRFDSILYVFFGLGSAIHGRTLLIARATRAMKGQRGVIW